MDAYSFEPVNFQNCKLSSSSRLLEDCFARPVASKRETSTNQAVELVIAAAVGSAAVLATPLIKSLLLRGETKASTAVAQLPAAGRFFNARLTQNTMGQIETSFGQELARRSGNKQAMLEQLAAPEVAKVDIVKGVYSKGTRFEDFQDYFMRGVAYGEREMAVYPLKSNSFTSIAVPNTKSAERIAAKVVGLLPEIPDMSLVRRINVFQHSHSLDPWLKQAHPDARMLGEAKPGGIINLHNPRFSKETSDTLVHEWNHLFRLEEKTAGRYFEMAETMEPLRTSSLSFAGHGGQDEGWAILGESLLCSDALTMASTAKLNPIKSSIWGQAFEERLNTLPAHLQGPNHLSFRKLAELIRDEIKPDAINSLKSLSEQVGLRGDSARKISKYLNQ